jgi:ElaB/YqjD/DUF883 family membrane-anchored ribosome-binding protein
MDRTHFDGLEGDVVPELVQRAKAADDKLVAFVRKRPVAALCTALALGYLIGRVASRLA